MAELKRTVELDPAEVDAEHRLRDVSESAVESLMASIAELGVLKDEIIVREVPHQGGKLKLIAGAHRLEACRRMGRTVWAKVYTCSDDWARLMELDDNIAGAELTVLDTAVFLAERKRVYEKVHPETRAGVAGALHKNCATDTMSVASFAVATAEKLGLTERHVRRLIVAGSRLDERAVELLRRAPRPVQLKDLNTLARIDDAALRDGVVRGLAAGEAKSAAAAMRALRDPEPPKDPVEEAHKALLTAWRRSKKEARKRFVRDERAALAAILAEVDDEDEGGGT